MRTVKKQICRSSVKFLDRIVQKARKRVSKAKLDTLLQVAMTQGNELERLDKKNLCF